jgi:outer membrane protein OmpA-like peptidoglycan-associated protein
MGSLFGATAGVVLVGALAFPGTADAQGIFGRIKDKVQQKVQQKVDRATDSVTSAAVDKAAGAITCAASDASCIKNASSAGHAVQVVDSQGRPVSSSDSAAAMSGAGGTAGGATASAGTAAPGAGVWLNYDFIPGDRVLFFDDFADDKVGDLPAHPDITDGNVTVVDINGKKYLRTVTGATSFITLPEALPQRFTIEIVFHRKGGNGSGLYFKIGTSNNDQELSLGCEQSGNASASIQGYGANGQKQARDEVKMDENAFATCRYMVDGGYVKAYVNNVRVGQLAGLTFARGNKIQLDIPNADENGTLITDIRIAEGGKPMYDALTTSGRVSTHGILFASGSATIEGESTPTLTEIGNMLKAHPDLKLTVEGHTDNVGNAAANQALSQQRAAAVTQYLVSNFQIDASRLAPKGMGDTKPVAPNTTPEGRQMNRRVELVKM